MKLLILTQKIDREDPVLSFFHGWVFELAKKFEKISVICLEKGNYDLPVNVSVFSLGKEKNKNRFLYLLKFFHFSFFSPPAGGLNYDSVFIHMNQEYVLLGGFIWKILRKKIYFWRNHPVGNWLTRIAVWLSDKVFYTSPASYTARFKKSTKMPVGIDIDKFVKFKSFKVHKVKNSILFLSRMARIKRPDLLIKALNILNKKEVDFVCNFYGDPALGNEIYFHSLKEKMKEFQLENKINFHKGVANYQTPNIYNKHSIFVNLTPPGSFDKTIFEAAVCGCLPIVANKSLSKEIPETLIVEAEPMAIADKIKYWLERTETEKGKIVQEISQYAEKNHSLEVLMDKLEVEIKNE